MRKSFFLGLGVTFFSRYLSYYLFSLRILILCACQFGTGQRLWTRIAGFRKILNKETFFRMLLNEKPFASDLLIDNFPASKWSNFEATWSRFSFDAFYHTQHCAICTVCHFLSRQSVRSIHGTLDDGMNSASTVHTTSPLIQWQRSQGHLPHCSHHWHRRAALDIHIWMFSCRICTSSTYGLFSYVCYDVILLQHRAHRKAGQKMLLIETQLEKSSQRHDSECMGGAASHKFYAQHDWKNVNI